VIKKFIIQQIWKNIDLILWEMSWFQYMMPLLKNLTLVKLWILLKITHYMKYLHKRIVQTWYAKVHMPQSVKVHATLPQLEQLTKPTVSLPILSIQIWSRTNRLNRKIVNQNSKYHAKLNSIKLTGMQLKSGQSLMMHSKVQLKWSSFQTKFRKK